MRIAMMVRGLIPVPRPKDLIYANIDLAVDIAEGLARKGHTVDFYAPMGSKLKRAHVQTCNLRPLVTNVEEFRNLLGDSERLFHGIVQLWDHYMADVMFKRALAHEYDILHFEHPESALSLAHIHRSVPVTYTLNDPVNEWSKEVFEIFQTPNQYFISISDNQRRDAPDLPYLRTIHNGVNLKDFSFNSKPEDFLLFVGRITQEKGVKEAIQVARETHHRLLIIGPVHYDSAVYYEQYIKPQLDDQILHLGFVERDQLPKYYQKAKALLTPVQWEEPFGMTTIEAMACGTPVVSFNRGAAPEIIENGKTGYVVDTTAEMVDAVHKLNRIKRAYCREYVEKKFSVRRMVNDYENAFHEVIEQHKILSTHFVKRQLSKVPSKIIETSRKRRLRKIIKARPFKQLR
jgi:glycosyltransferase involved in cell wall biosynthesis